MPPDSLTPDLNDTACCVGGCVAVADIIGQAAVTLHHETGVPDDQRDLVLELPLCADHAHLLRLGVERCDLTTW
jgi:hypothetical protein